MKKLTIPFLLLIVACDGDGKYEPAEDAQDAGRQFIRASLDGDHKKAGFYLLQDSTNLMLLEKQRTNYRDLTRDAKRNYRDASIIPLSIKPIDSVTYQYKYYPSSNPGDTTTLRILKKNNEWLVDLKSIIKTQ